MIRRFRSAAALASALLLSACSGASVLNALTSRADYRIERSLRYAPGSRGTFDLYVPADAGPATPAVVFIYGGSWDSGTKAMYLFVGQSLANQGFIVAIPDYRVYPEVVFPGFVEDAAEATAAVGRGLRGGLANVPAGDHPLFLMGHSAGAEIAALLALDAHYLSDANFPAGRLAGFVGLSGPYDFLPLKEERYKRIFPEATRALSQPVRFARRAAPPSLLLTGLADTTVDPENTRSLERRLRAAGANVTAHLYPGIDHAGTITSFATALSLGNRAIRDEVVAFLRSRSK